MNDPQSRLDVIDHDGLVRVVGEIDAHSAPALAERLSRFEGASDRRIDMTGVEFMDSSGLRVLVDAHQKAVDDGARLVLVGPGRAVTRIVELSGLAGHLNVEPAEV